MHHLLDTNVIIELNKHNLFDRFLKTFSIAREDIFVLKEIWHKLSNEPDFSGKKPFSEKLLKRCVNFCTGLEVIRTPYADPAERNALQKKHPDIRVDGRGVKLDEGEAQLFAFSSQLTDFRIYTADRNALRALSGWPDCDSVRQRLNGRIMCLERVLRELTVTHGISRMPVALREYHDPIGKAMRAANQDQCCKILKMAEDQLQTVLGGLLAP